ncbi:uncharacterized protein METZ01_LOCUS461206 [marine metagenome]|uniref:Uncharacterized protein n=1 Tax=marine metagenome TaxID=408172 RepID=A0A383AKR8_9ZZZZ
MPAIPVTMVTHVPMAPGTTNPQTHNETLTSLLISFIYGSDHWSRLPVLVLFTLHSRVTDALQVALV